MTKTKLVIRLLDASGALLGWAEHQAAVRGDGKIRASETVVIPVDRVGAPVTASVHWTDVNVEFRWPVHLARLPRIGEGVTLWGADYPLIDVGAPPVGLPPVTLGGNVLVDLPVGTLGAATK